MAVYSYQVKKLGQKNIQRGQLQADSLSEANKSLRNQGYLVLNIDLSVAQTGKQFSFRRHHVPLKEKIIFSRQLSAMVKAGLSIVKALESLSQQTENKHFSKILHEMIEKVKGGEVLSKAMSRYPEVFADVYIAVIKAGEQTGQLTDVLANLADQQEKEADLISKVKGAMIYPAVIFTLLMAVVVLIVVFVIPSLETIFNDAGADLPFLTRFLIATSNIVRHYYWIVIPILIGLYLLLRMYLKTPRGHGQYDAFKIRIPIFGSLIKKVYMARFSRTMAMLIKSSLPIMQAIQIIRKTIKNVHYDQAFARIEHAVEEGKSFSAAINREALFPPMVSQLVSLGEESGNMEAVLLDIATFYDKEVDTMSRNLTTLLEPIMLVVMGVGIGFVVASVLGPIYSLVQAF